MSLFGSRVALLILTLMLTATAWPAAAQPPGARLLPPGPPGAMMFGPPPAPPIPGIWKNPYLAAFLQLSNRQALELEQIDARLRSGLAPLDKKLTQAFASMEQAFKTWPVYEAAVKARAMEIAKLQRQRLLLLTQSRVQVHNLLTQTQLKKLASLLPPRPVPPVAPPPGFQRSTSPPTPLNAP